MIAWLAFLAFLVLFVAVCVATWLVTAIVWDGPWWHYATAGFLNGALLGRLIVWRVGL